MVDFSNGWYDSIEPFYGGGSNDSDDEVNEDLEGLEDLDGYLNDDFTID